MKINTLFVHYFFVILLVLAGACSSKDSDNKDIAKDSVENITRVDSSNRIAQAEDRAQREDSIQGESPSFRKLIDISAFSLSGVKLGDTKDKIYKIFGRPDSVENFTFEIDDAEGEVFNYGKNKLYILHNKLDLLDGKFTISPLKIRVGSTCNELQEYFLDPCKYKGLKTFTVPFEGKDLYVEVEVNNSVVTRIGLWEPS